MYPLVTASMLYDLVLCPHRVTMDIFADSTERDAPNAFIRLLWERGVIYEKEVIEGLEVPFTDLSICPDDKKEQLTLEAMRRGDSLIYGARIQAEGLLGDPDLLRKEGGGYTAGDIKSGAGEEGPEDSSKPKKHYAAKLGLYIDILERMTFHPAGAHLSGTSTVKKSPTISRNYTVKRIHARSGKTIRITLLRQRQLSNSPRRRLPLTVVTVNTAIGTAPVSRI